MNFNEVTFEFAAGRVDQLPESDMPEIVFSGHSNVGKSSLINKLVQRKALARVSAQPAKRLPLIFISSKSFVWLICRATVMQRFQKQKKTDGQSLWKATLHRTDSVRSLFRFLTCVILRLMMTLHMIDFLYRGGFNFAAVLTKSDKLKKTAFEKQIEYYKDIFSAIEHVPLIPFSAQTGFGNDEIRKLIETSIANFKNTEV